MRVDVLSATSNPIDACSIAAGVCYGKRNVIEGISRACSHQLVRHRLASYCQESQRYNRYDFAGDDWYVKPDAFEGVALGLAEEVTFGCAMQAAAYAYRYALDAGIKPEDARYLLPEATKTSVACTMNLRQFFHLLDMRDDQHAQWEIRGLAQAMKSVLSGVSSEWQYMVGLYDKRA